MATGAALAVMALVLVLAAAVLAFPTTSVLPATLRQSDLRPAEHVYVASLYLGSPAEELELEVRFDVAGLFVYRRQEVHSASQAAGTEIVFWGGTPLRTPVADGARRPPGALCGACGGVLGLRFDSFVWRWWAEGTLTHASITLGGMAPVAAGPENAVARVNCASPAPGEAVLGALCVSACAWEWGGRVYDFPAIIAPHLPAVYAPDVVYGSYLRGKNINEKPGGWEPLLLDMYNASLAFDADELSAQHGVEARDLLLRPWPGSGDAFAVGSAVLRHAVLHYSAPHGTLHIRAHAVHEHLSVVNLILFAVLFFFLVRWKMTNMQHSFMHPRRRYWLDYLFEVGGIVLGTTAIFLQNVRGILSEFPVLYTLVIAIYALAVTMEGVSKYLFFRYVRGRAGGAAADRLLFMAKFIETVWHEAILALALWALVAERRREGVANVLALLLNIYNLFSITVNFFILVHYFAMLAAAGGQGQKKNKKKRRRKSTAAVSVATGLASASLAFLVPVYVFITAAYFATPILTRNAQIYTELILPALLVGAAAVATAAFFLVDTYIRQIARSLLERADEEGIVPESEPTEAITLCLAGRHG
jgi:hypothetical protein